MTALATIRMVAWREIKQRAQSKAYLFTSLITILFVLGIILVPGFFGESTESYKVGSVGPGNEAIIETAVVLGTASDEPGTDPSLAITAVPFSDREEASKALEDGDVDAVLVDGRELIVDRTGGIFIESGPGDLLQQSAGAIAIESIVAKNGQTAEDVIALLTSDALEVETLSDEAETNDGGEIVAYFGLLLLYMAIILYGTWILTGVTEEKTNRVIEVLISAVRPWQLLAGKILGIGALAITQFASTLVIAYVALNLANSFELPALSASSLLNLAIWFLLGFLLYATLFGAAGSLVSRVEEAQSAAMPLTIFSVGGFFAGFAVLGNPTGTVAVVTTMIPFTAPFVVPIRVSLHAIPVWQYGLSVLLTLAFLYLSIRVAGRIYAGGLLRFGSRTKLREAWSSSDNGKS